MYVGAFLVLGQRQIFLYCIELCLRIISSWWTKQETRGISDKSDHHLMVCVSCIRTGNVISFVPPFCEIFWKKFFAQISYSLKWTKLLKRKNWPPFCSTLLKKWFKANLIKGSPRSQVRMHRVQSFERFVHVVLQQHNWNKIIILMRP